MKKIEFFDIQFFLIFSNNEVLKKENCSSDLYTLTLFYNCQVLIFMNNYAFRTLHLFVNSYGYYISYFCFHPSCIIIEITFMVFTNYITLTK